MCTTKVECLNSTFDSLMYMFEILRASRIMRRQVKWRPCGRISGRYARKDLGTLPHPMVIESVSRLSRSRPHKWWRVIFAARARNASPCAVAKKRVPSPTTWSLIRRRCIVRLATEHASLVAFCPSCRVVYDDLIWERGRVREKEREQQRAVFSQIVNEPRCLSNTFLF